MSGFTETSFGLLILSLALMTTVQGGTCPTGVTSANDCLYTASFNALNQGDPGLYCQQGAILSAQAKNCLRDCSYNENDPALLAQMQKINKFCNSTTPDGSCPTVTDSYVNQSRSFDPYGGISTIVQNIINAFETGGTTSAAFSLACNQLSWGRYTLNKQTCSYNQYLNVTWIKQNRIYLTGTAICGSEQLQTTLEQMELTSGCSATDYSAIASKCDISCAVANAPNQGALCGLLAGQATCLQTSIVNCTAAERSLVLPRLNTYAIANQYLKCSIKYNGFTVKTTGLTSQYTPLINACLFSNTVEDALVFERLLPLINGDLPVGAFCASTAAQQASNLTNCRNLFAGAFTPQSKLLTRQSDLKYNLDQSVNFYPNMGGFPLDNYAMAYLFKTLVCPAKYSNRICVSDADKPATTKAPPVAPGNIDNPSTAAPVIIEEPASSGASTRGQNSVDYGTSSSASSGASTRGQNSVDYGTSSSDTLTPTILLIVSAILSIMY